MKTAPSYSSIAATAAVAGVFSTVVCGLLIVNFLGRSAALPLEGPQYLALKDRLETHSDRVEIQAQIRQRDLAVRQEYFRQQTFAWTGAYLLAGGVGVTVLLCQWATTVRRQLPAYRTAEIDDSETRRNQWAQWACAVLIGGLLLVTLGPRVVSPKVLPRSDIPTTGLVSVATGDPPRRSASAVENTATADSVSQVAGAEKLPTPESIMRNWHRFRGPQGTGLSVFTDVSQVWDGSTGEGIKWKTAVDLPGVSSPIVWDDRVFLTGANPERCEVYCFDREDGVLLWQRTVDTGAPPATGLKVNSMTGYAASTPTTDGRRVYAMFANGDIGAFDFAGNQVWSRSLGAPENPYGHAASLVTSDGLLIVQFDQGRADDGKSKLIALRGSTGEVAWQVDRPVAASWATPLVVDFQNQTRIITCADPGIIAYAADSGEEIWRAGCLQGDVGPSPTYADGVVYVAADYALAAAVRDGGQGDVTESHILWTADLSLPDICSPLVTERYLLFGASYGALVCYDRERGGEEPLWEKDLGAMVASPSLVGDLVYLFGDDGTGWIVKPAGDGCEILAENNLGERCYASPAFGPGRIYVRGEQHLFCIGQ